MAWPMRLFNSLSSLDHFQNWSKSSRADQNSAKDEVSEIIVSRLKNNKKDLRNEN